MCILLNKLQKSTERQRIHKIYRGSLSVWELLIFIGSGDFTIVDKTLQYSIVEARIRREKVERECRKCSEWRSFGYVVMPLIYRKWLLTLVARFHANLALFAYGKLHFLVLIDFNCSTSFLEIGISDRFSWFLTWLHDIFSWYLCITKSWKFPNLNMIYSWNDASVD